MLIFHFEEKYFLILGTWYAAFEGKVQLRLLLANISKTTHTRTLIYFISHRTFRDQHLGITHAYFVWQYNIVCHYIRKPISSRDKKVFLVLGKEQIKLTSLFKGNRNI